MENISKLSYRDRRLQQIGATAEDNKIMLWRGTEKKDDNGVMWPKEELHPEEIFAERKEGLSILIYTIEGYKIRFNDEKIDDNGKAVGSRIKKKFLSHPL